MIQRKSANANVSNNIKDVILVQQAVIAPPQVRLNVFVTANVASGTGGAGPQEEVTILWMPLKIVVIKRRFAKRDALAAHPKKSIYRDGVQDILGSETDFMMRKKMKTLVLTHLAATYSLKLQNADNGTCPTMMTILGIHILLLTH